MGIVATDNKYYSDIADAIREKNGESTLYLPAEMAPAILAIEGNSGYTVTVRNCGANTTVTAKHGNRQDTVTADSNGTAVFDDLTKGVWVFMTEAQEKTSFAEIFTDVELDFNVTPFNPSPNGLILCTAPIGSTVTASNGTTTFKADKTLIGENEIHVISIKPEYFSGTPITVTCTRDDGTSDTQTAVINSKKDVELNFNLKYLIYNGRVQTDKFGTIGAGTSGFGWMSAELVMPDSEIVYADGYIQGAARPGLYVGFVGFNEKIDLSPFETLNADIRYTTSNNENGLYLTPIKTDIRQSFAAFQNITGTDRVITQMPVIDGEYHIVAVASYDSALELYNLWLE